MIITTTTATTTTKRSKTTTITIVITITITIKIIVYSPATLQGHKNNIIIHESENKMKMNNYSCE